MDWPDDPLERVAKRKRPLLPVVTSPLPPEEEEAGKQLPPVVEEDEVMLPLPRVWDNPVFKKATPRDFSSSDDDVSISS